MKKKTTTKKVVKRVTKAKPKEETYSWVVEPDIEAIKLQKELEEVCSWKSVSSEKVLRLYDLNKKIFKDNFNHCTKCPAAIRNVFKKVKIYYEQNKTS